MSVTTTAEHEALMQALMDPARWSAGGAERRRIDTHISTVILAGELAYKIKKPLDLGFLDFLSLEARASACRAELRLNGRLAPEIYQGVSAVTGSIERPQMDGTGEIIDWAVRMRRFDPDAILSNLTDQLDTELIRSLADRIAGFHQTIDICDEAAPFGGLDAVIEPMRQNLVQIRRLAPSFGEGLGGLETWTEEQARTLESALLRRKADGHIRECHGDLHLGNVALIEGQAVVFDAIEFNPGLRWIDTINDVAFMTMDLEERGRSDLAHVFLDRYLQRIGDYEALALLRFYEVYRALVRAKIAAIRYAQLEPKNGERSAVEAELEGYLRFAQRLIRPRRGALVITRGVSGSGKSHVAAGIPARLPAVRLRSDVERKRLLGIAATEDATARGAYTQEVTEQTYRRLLELAGVVARAGYIAVVDATFLKQSQRRPFAALAETMGLPFAILDCGAPLPVLRDRIRDRAGEADNVSDADLAVLDAQLATTELLTEQESRVSVDVSPDHPLDFEGLGRLIGQHCFDDSGQSSA